MSRSALRLLVALSAAVVLATVGADPAGAQSPPREAEGARTRTGLGDPTVRWRQVRDADVLRGVWVSRWEYSTPDDVRALLSSAATSGMTDVFFQVRGRADAFYASTIEPWAAELTGRLGQDPGWDPLAVSVAEAHARGLRLHAWINTFPIWSGSSPPPFSTPEHVFRTHPEWIMADRTGQTLRLGNRFGYVSASPGNPQVQDHIEAVVLDIVNRYAVDGVHFDYIRLPDQDYSYDAVSRGRYLRESTTETYIQWQAQEISGMLREIAGQARALDPDLILTAAVVNRYERAISIFAQDPADWVGSGALDYVIAMAYTPDPDEFGDLVDSYRAHLPADGLAAGISLDETRGDPGAVAAEVHTSVLAGVRGHVFFSLEGLLWLAGHSVGGDVYSYLEGVRGMRFAAAAGVQPGEREAPQPAFTDSTVAPPGAPETTPDASTDETARPSRRGIPRRYLLPAVAGALLIALILIP